MKYLVGLVVCLWAATGFGAEEGEWLFIDKGHLTTYDATLIGKNCEIYENQSIACEYQVGEGLHFVITDIGGQAGAVSFWKSSRESDFYAAFGLRHGCIVVRRGTQSVASIPEAAQKLIDDVAYVSPANGKVYREWQKCMNRE
jgi:hypothetical protein